LIRQTPIREECNDFVQESIAAVLGAIQVHKMRRVGQSQDTDGGCVSCVVGESLHILRPTPEISIGTYEQNVRSDRGSIEESPAAGLIEAVFDRPQRGAERRRLVCAGARIALQCGLLIGCRDRRISPCCFVIRR